ncbi:MAG: sigma-70 family RNA polymerase sigma factor [Acidimicrobiales bacterium]|nr:sigma-70 family RNA polymerase sigma factor [Acidimicrobiales bacterium]MCB1261161.1 sigma-70 family RNA polymerase sigma factor [Acidimicrobiales bacterium]
MPPGEDAPLQSAETFELLYRSEYARLVRLAFVLTGSVGAAEEEVQEAFAVAHRRWRTLQRYERPDLWMRRVVINRSLSRRRKQQSAARLASRLAAEPVPVDEPVLREPDRALWAAVRSLPRRQQEVLVLVVLDQRSFSEAAEVLDCAETTARTHYRRARLALAAALDPTEVVR